VQLDDEVNLAQLPYVLPGMLTARTRRGLDGATMKRELAAAGMAALIAVLALPNVVMALAIPDDKLDEQKIFWGNARDFEKPGEVDYSRIVRATPEYQELKKKRIKSGSAKYWLQVSAASNHAVRLISEVGRESEYDLIVSTGYLAKAEVDVAADNLTDAVLARLEPDADKDKDEKKK